MQTNDCEDTSENDLESHSQENWTNSSRICSFFQANILMYNEHLIYMYLLCENLNWYFLVHFLLIFNK